MSVVKTVCYTAITGQYDKIEDPAYVTSGIDYICFSDTAFKSDIWNLRPIPKDLLDLSLVKQQRVLKICPHRYLPEYDISIWVDGNILIKGDLNKFISEYDLSKIPLYTRIHPSRNCIYDEAKAILRYHKDSPESINELVTRYKNEDYPKHIGMAETCILLRKHNDIKCRLFDEAWATELLLHSHRDQMSFNYIAWKQGFPLGYMMNQFKITNNEYFGIKRHG